MSTESQDSKIKLKEPTIKRIGGYLHRVIPIADVTGEIISYTLKPLMVEFKPRDVLQVIVGASILAIPMAFTEEAWDLGRELPMSNIIMLAVVSVSFVGAFVFFNFYRYNIKGHFFSYLKRTVGTYLISLTVCGLILTLIEKCPWDIDYVLAIKRIVVVAFPASMSGTLSDTIK